MDGHHQRAIALSWPPTSSRMMRRSPRGPVSPAATGENRCRSARRKCLIWVAAGKTFARAIRPQGKCLNGDVMANRGSNELAAPGRGPRLSLKKAGRTGQPARQEAGADGVRPAVDLGK